MSQPKLTCGMVHVALNVKNMKECKDFYTKRLGMEVEWQPDPDNVYLSSGNDNLALHRAPESHDMSGPQRLDHIGFLVESPEEVDVWYQYLRVHDIPMKSEPRTHRDGARSFYCLDPDGNTVQVIFHPPIVKASSRL